MNLSYFFGKNQRISGGKGWSQHPVGFTEFSAAASAAQGFYMVTIFFLRRVNSDIPLIAYVAGGELGVHAQKQVLAEVNSLKFGCVCAVFQIAVAEAVEFGLVSDYGG